MIVSLQAWYEKGMTFEQYRASMQVNGQEFTRVYDGLRFTENDLESFKEVTARNWRGIVLTADWCGDAALCVPIIQKIAEVSNIELRFLIRDENLELMDQYLTNGTSRAIPRFIFFDKQGNETAVWGPRSNEVEDMVKTLRTELPAAVSPKFHEKQQSMFLSFMQRITSDPSIWRTVVESVKEKLKTQES
ncbi:thioredoxin family protein [Bacillus sp. DJP31]|uniref:thioredoxin family protein n=1 Tax=Bacillus sp. DJP31 TaxID=3409789 RepID=UPI003BB75225